MLAIIQSFLQLHSLHRPFQINVEPGKGSQSAPSVMQVIAGIKFATEQKDCRKKAIIKA
jgi:hypothetical protein